VRILRVESFNVPVDCAVHFIVIDEVLKDHKEELISLDIVI